jgi:hypothetical protein
MLQHEFGSKIEFREDLKFDFSSEESEKEEVVKEKEDSIHSFIEANENNLHGLFKSKSF